MKQLLMSASIVLFFLPNILPAQIQFKSAEGLGVGIGVTDMSLIDRLMVTVPGVGSNARDMLMVQSIKQHMMPVRKVGIRGSDLSYALASCLEYYVNLGKNYKDNLSPDYISLSLQNSGRRVTMEEAFSFLVENGTVSAAIVPFDAAVIPNAVYATNKYKINNYLYIFRDVTQGRQKIFETRKALMRGNPVLIELLADPSIKTVNGDRVWEPSRAGTQKFPLIVVGYDEGREAFEVLSCWGADWGNGGYIWVDYDDFSKQTANGFVMVPQVQY
jgi:hypothetical protein